MEFTEWLTHLMLKHGLSKAELARLAKPFPFELVWSCYFAGEKPCGRCESCQRFARARGGKSC